MDSSSVPILLCVLSHPADSDSSGFLSSDEEDDAQADKACVLDSAPERGDLARELCVGLLSSLRA